MFEVVLWSQAGNVGADNSRDEKPELMQNVRGLNGTYENSVHLQAITRRDKTSRVESRLCRDQTTN